jgi:selenocysteine lyase/cysteine desulfurase
MNTHEWIDCWHTFLKENPQLQLQSMEITLSLPDKSIAEIAKDETFWRYIQSLFPTPAQHVNLNNGGVCSNPLHVEQAYKDYYSLLNTSPSYFTWKVMEAARDTIKNGLAHMCNASTEEIALFRNATEALNNAIFGIPLNAHDEVVACRQDYIKCVSSWKQRELREHIKINWVELNGTENNDEIIQKYVAAFTPATKVLHLTHVINWNGQVLPIEAIAYEAKKRDIVIVLDAAHSFAVVETDVRKIDCDYMGVALHKWLSGPIASGMLYIKKDRIAHTYPLASALEPLADSIKKFEEMSIQVLPNLLALGYAIQFHLQLTRDVKEARLTYLRQRWTDALQKLDTITFNVPLNATQCKGIASFHINDEDPLQIEKQLFELHGIHVVGFKWPNLSGIRVTPNVYTPIEDIDSFVLAIKKLV